MLYAFDLLELDGEDLRALPLGDRKKRLAKLVGQTADRHRRGGGTMVTCTTGEAYETSPFAVCYAAAADGKDVTMCVAWTSRPAGASQMGLETWQSAWLVARARSSLLIASIWSQAGFSRPG
jgi:hypothetical protein